MTQLTLYDFKEEKKDKNALTSRDWKFYEFLKDNPNGFKKQEDMLVAYENYVLATYFNSEYSFNYFEEKRACKHFSDMSSARAMRKTIERLRANDIIQKVIVTNKVAGSVKEAQDYLLRKKIKTLKELKSYWKDIERLEKHFQQRLVFGKEREQIEAILEKE